MKAEDVPDYERVDTEIADAEDRPKKWAYDRYAYLVKLAHENNYDDKKIQEKSPFLIKDVLLNTVAVKANRDLAKIAELIGEDGSQFNEWADLTSRSLDEKLWDEEHATYFDYDMKAGELIDSHVAAGFTPIFGKIPSQERAVKICAKLNTRSFCKLDDTCLAVPSYDKYEPGFSPNRYWRGPIWINMNWLLYHGLRAYGLHDYADRVKETIMGLPNQCGIYEYYDPEEGKGHGASNFSWTAALLIDLRGAYMCAREAIKHFLAESKPGVIINISSVHERIPKPGYIGYSVSKGGMGNLTKTLALEYSDKNIRINSVAPGAIITPINRSWIDDPKKKASIETHIPMKRAGTVDDIAAVVEFLASDLAAYITGQTLYVDGGLTLYPGFKEAWTS